jgi:hypothetical protein
MRSRMPRSAADEEWPRIETRELCDMSQKKFRTHPPVRPTELIERGHSVATDTCGFPRTVRHTASEGAGRMSSYLDDRALAGPTRIRPTGVTSYCLY